MNTSLVRHSVKNHQEEVTLILHVPIQKSSDCAFWNPDLQARAACNQFHDLATMAHNTEGSKCIRVPPCPPKSVWGGLRHTPFLVGLKHDHIIVGHYFSILMCVILGSDLAARCEWLRFIGYIR